MKNDTVLSGAPFSTGDGWIHKIKKQASHHVVLIRNSEGVFEWFAIVVKVTNQGFYWQRNILGKPVKGYISFSNLEFREGGSPQ